MIEKCWTLRKSGFSLAAIACFGLGQEALDAQVMPPPPALSDVTRRIAFVSPLSGPAGTEVRVRAEGLRPGRSVHIGIGELQGCGYQVCEPATVDPSGAVETTVEVPDWGHYNHYEVVMVLDEDFVPLAVSDPFHVVDENGMMRREGTVLTAWPGCPALITDDGVAYALVGEHTLGLMASQGETLRLEGRPAGPACTLQYSMEVVDVELLP
ncbi:MAG: hypothetical protein U5R14_07455 [Gemmatimonadota bacterium]|nr:hypothetical protein [Gemmatimonadota bacterium]